MVGFCYTVLPPVIDIMATDTENDDIRITWEVWPQPIFYSAYMYFAVLDTRTQLLCARN